MTGICNRCEIETDDLGTCEECNELVCIDCMKHASGPHECIECVICAECHDDREMKAWADGRREWKAKKQKADKARARYNSPAACAKRAAKRAAIAKFNDERAAQSRADVAERLAEVMAGFAKFF